MACDHYDRSCSRRKPERMLSRAQGGNTPLRHDKRATQPSEHDRKVGFQRAG